MNNPVRKEGHIVSSQWYTPPAIWQRIRNTLGANIFDPCPSSYSPETNNSGLSYDWATVVETLDYGAIYVNPPSPAKDWAKKAIATHKKSGIPIIFAAFSTSLIHQVPELMDFWGCYVEKRIQWIDGNKWVKSKTKDDEEMKPNPYYLKPNPRPTNYNAFFLLCGSEQPYEKHIINKFDDNFKNLGSVRRSFTKTPGVY